MEAPSKAVVEAVCLGPGGIPKQAVERARVHALGLEGDGHRYHLHGGEDRAVCLLSVELVETLRDADVEGCAPGAFGENVLTRGIDLCALAVGDRLALGDEVVIELTDVRAPCHVLKGVDARFPDLMLGHSGWVARVLREGTLARGDRVSVVPSAPA